MASPYSRKNADSINGWIKFSVLVNGYNSIEINTMTLKLPVNTRTWLRFWDPIWKCDLTFGFM